MTERRPTIRVTHIDPSGRAWDATEVARLCAVVASYDAPVARLLIRFASEGEERFACCPPIRWYDAPHLARLFDRARPMGDDGGETR